MYVGLKQPLGDGERCVTSARAAVKETNAKLLKSANYASSAFFGKSMKNMLVTTN